MSNDATSSYLSHSTRCCSSPNQADFILSLFIITDYTQQAHTTYSVQSNKQTQQTKEETPSPASFYKYLNILNVFNKKLSDIGLSLHKTTIIDNTNRHDLLVQFKFEIEKLKENSLNRLVVTTTAPWLDSLMDSLLRDAIQATDSGLSLESAECALKGVRLYDDRVFLLKNASINENLSVLIDYFHSNSASMKLKHYFAFETFIELKRFMFELGSTFCKSSKLFNQLSEPEFEMRFKQRPVESEHNLILLKNDSFQVRNLFSNYYNYLIELCVYGEDNKSFKIEEVTSFKPLNRSLNLNNNQVSLKSHLILDNFINADHYVYEFDLLLNELMSDPQTGLIRSDIALLLGKIDLAKFQAKLKQSIEHIENAIRKYTNEQMCVSYNGGKDCHVVLYLFYAVSLRLGNRFPLNILFIRIKNPFNEMELFIQLLLNEFLRNSLKFICFDDTSKSLKDCLKDLKASKSELYAIFMGTRRSDGNYFRSMPVEAKTDGDWPEFMRINPILDWTFSEIWFFVRLLRLPYCSLYDKGYTSLDNSLNSIPNKALLVDKQTGFDNIYLPAYMLENPDDERNSRRPLTS
jgi:3'-phosphoadenosine 5'-phosphosulfate sulfotransferase (PAPS reductase)/FAD synthetase